MDATEKQEITDLVREAVGEAVHPLARRVESIEIKVDKAATDLHEIREQVRTLLAADLAFSEKLRKIAGAVADAADIGLKAMRRASDAEDNTSKIVQSALTIHNASIAASVEATVTKVIKPLDEKIEATEKRQESVSKAQTETLAAQNETLADIKKVLGTVAKALGHPHLRKAIIIAAVLGALVGGAVAGYSGVAGKDAIKQLLP